MSETLLEKHEDLVMELAESFMNNMELELGKKYEDNSYDIKPGLSDVQHTVLKYKYKIQDRIYADIYSEFQKMEPPLHLKNAMDAFTASGGNVDIEPSYDESEHRMSVNIRFVIKDRTLDSIEGLSPLEGIMLKLNAMLQINTLLSGNDTTVSSGF